MQGRKTTLNWKGPLAAYAHGFDQELRRQGFSVHGRTTQLRLAGDLSRRLEEHGLGADGLTPEFGTEYLRESGSRSHHGLKPLFTYLRSLGVVSSPKPVETPLDGVLDRYRRYLVEERGLKATTVGGCMELARRFLGGHVVGGVLQLEKVDAAGVVRFILQETEHWRVATAKGTATKLRCLLRHLHLAGEISDLAGAVPTVAGWRGGQLPRTPDPEQVERLLAGCDRSLRWGRRAFAVLKLMARLGLRASEVAALELDDIDWAAGDLVVRGKGSTLERLPLPEDVGEALSDYLVHDRPPLVSRRVFLTVRAPIQGMASSGVQSVVTAACWRVGVSGLSAHLLRHDTATRLLRAGASLREVGQVLRHRHLSTTVIYAKVDRRSLGVLARPWPGSAS